MQTADPRDTAFLPYRLARTLYDTAVSEVPLVGARRVPCPLLEAASALRAQLGRATRGTVRVSGDTLGELWAAADAQDAPATRALAEAATERAGF